MAFGDIPTGTPDSLIVKTEKEWLKMHQVLRNNEAYKEKIKWKADKILTKLKDADTKINGAQFQEALLHELQDLYEEAVQLRQEEFGFTRDKKIGLEPSSKLSLEDFIMKDFELLENRNEDGRKIHENLTEIAKGLAASPEDLGEGEKNLFWIRERGELKARVRYDQVDAIGKKIDEYDEIFRKFYGKDYATLPLHQGFEKIRKGLNALKTEEPDPMRGYALHQWKNDYAPRTMDMRGPRMAILLFSGTMATIGLLFGRDQWATYMWLGIAMYAKNPKIFEGNQELERAVKSYAKFTGAENLPLIRAFNDKALAELQEADPEKVKNLKEKIASGVALSEADIGTITDGTKESELFKAFNTFPEAKKREAVTTALQNLYRPSEDELAIVEDMIEHNAQLL